MILAALFLGILFTSFGVLLQALYLSGDMDFLLTSPVPIRAVFVTKLLQAVLPNFGLIALFGLPVLFGLGFSEHYNFLYYPLVLLIMIALTLAAAGTVGAAGHAGGAHLAAPAGGGGPGFHRRHHFDPVRSDRQPVQCLRDETSRSRDPR